VPIFLSPQPRHVLEAIADVGSRDEADGIYNGLLLLAHSSGMGATPIVLQMNLQADLGMPATIAKLRHDRSYIDLAPCLSPILYKLTRG
jgi:hypothetical protein